MAKKIKPRLVDRLTYCAAIIEPVITVPQAVTIFQRHSATAISLSTWVGYEGLTLVWLWYGLVHRERMILTYQGLFFITQAAVIIGAFIYGAKW